MIEHHGRRREAPILLMGAPRSGTTYLMEVLNQHPQVAIEPETRVFTWLERAIRLASDDDFLVYAHRTEFVEILHRQLPAMIDGFHRALHPEARYWGDKNPFYAAGRGTMEKVAELLPGTQVVHLLRDGRDVVASLMQKVTDGQRWAGFTEAHAIWLSHVIDGRASGARFPGTYHEVRYEELVDDGPAVAARLLAALDVPHHEAVTAYCKAQERRRTPLSGPTRDLDAPDRGSAWSEVLDEQQQRWSLALLGDHLVEFGYETRASLAALEEQHGVERTHGPPWSVP